MNINWKIRLHNPTFWRNIIIAVAVTIGAQLGLELQQITTWAALGDALLQAIGNPVVIVAVLGVIWNAINDPTTAGDSDSTQALTYEEPKK